MIVAKYSTNWRWRHFSKTSSILINIDTTRERSPFSARTYNNDKLIFMSHRCFSRLVCNLKYVTLIKSSIFSFFLLPGIGHSIATVVYPVPDNRQKLSGEFSMDSLKCPCDQKNHFPFFLGFWKCVCLTLDWQNFDLWFLSKSCLLRE